MSYTPLCTFTHFTCNLGYFSQFWANFKIFGTKKHALKVENLMLVLVDAIGLLKGPNVIKKRPRAPKNRPKVPHGSLLGLEEGAPVQVTIG